jgi:arylsulfatase A-like enzyme
LPVWKTPGYNAALRNGRIAEAVVCPTSRRWPFVFLIGWLAIGSCSPSHPKGPNILLIVADALRPDPLGVYGRRGDLTPALDELGRHGAVFAHAYAASSWTSPSVASLFTSRYPSQHGVNAFTAPLGDAEVTLAERLAAAGYLTAGFSANLIRAEAGYAQGFRHWRVAVGDPKTRATELNREVLRWLADARAHGSDPPIMLYLHYMEPHAPYLPPGPDREHAGSGADQQAAAMQKLLDFRYGELSRAEVDLLRSLYDREVASLDVALNALFAGLRRHRFLDHCIVIFTADHGEEFGEHGGMMHAVTLYEESIRVPLIIRRSDQSEHRVVTEPVSLIDVAPTLLELAALPAEPRFEGRSLVPVLNGQAARPRDILVELESDVVGALRQHRGLTPGAEDTRRHAQAIIRGAAKLLLSPGGATEAYDLAGDPGETRPNAAPIAARTAELQAVLLDTRRRLAQRANPNVTSQPLDKSDRERLRALGYVTD